MRMTASPEGGRNGAEWCHLALPHFLLTGTIQLRESYRHWNRMLTGHEGTIDQARIAGVPPLEAVGEPDGLLRGSIGTIKSWQQLPTSQSSTSQ